MKKLSNLLNTIDSFHDRALRAYKMYKLAAEPYTFNMPDDPEDDDEESDQPVGNNANLGKYDQLVRLSGQVSDPELGSELLLIAEMYKRALELGAGYGVINNGISNLINNYLDDEDNPEFEKVEDTLNDVVKDLRTRAGGPGALNKAESPQIIAQFKNLKDAFNRQSLEEDMRRLESGELTAEEAGGLTQFDEKAKSQFDMSGGVGMEEAQKGTGRGYSVQTKKDLKDWVKSYDDERARYIDLMGAQTDKQAVANMQKLIDILGQLKVNTAQEMEIAKNIAVAPDPALESKLADIKKSNTDLRDQRRKLKANVRYFELQKNRNNLEDKFKNTKDLKEKFVLQQELEYNKLLQSKDRNKGLETKLRRILLKSITGGNMPSKDTLDNMLSKIDEAAKLKVPASVYNKEIAKDIKTIKESGTFSGDLLKFKQSIPNIKMGIKKSVTDLIIKDLKSQQPTTFKPFIDKIAAAKAAGDKAGIEAASKELNNALNLKAINDEAEMHPKILDFVKGAKSFDTYKKELLKNEKIIVTSGDIATEKLPELAAIVNLGKVIINEFQNNATFRTLVIQVANLNQQLERRIQ